MSSRRHFLKLGGLVTAGAMISPVSAVNTFHPQLLLIKPPALKPGDTVAITSPAGAVWDEKQIGVFTEILKGMGFHVIHGKTLKEKFGYFAGPDDLRASELNALFAEKSVKGIFCMKGGWGCARILNKLDFDLIRKNPKVIIGFSDITALLLAITATTGLVTFHGPVGNSGWNDFTKTVFSEVVMKPKPFTFPENPFNEEKYVVLNSGKASGELMGGNLTVLTGLIGSNFLPEWKNKILFLEEAKEEPYSIDRMLTQLKLAGVLDVISGFIFGKCAKCLAEEPLKAFTFQEVLEQHIKSLKIPAFYGAMIGHIENKLTVPLGIKATMDADKGTLILDENSVS
ncbi:MAG: peptidase LD-carboxypeptidase [Bacteroidetes bacterium]|jgi:muramoyltetrapeptide carboxypeptidase|nr:peptidase LD-carboxypeptidase [Bacteroidota bacterium]